MKRILLFAVAAIVAQSLLAQVVAGPMLGQVELKEAKIWLEVAPSVKAVKLVYGKKGTAAKKTVDYKGVLGKDFNPIQFNIGGLDINTTYDYSFVVDGKPAKQTGTFTTKDLWQWRKPVPDFSFLTGSCAYFNEPAVDRPGKPYGGDSSIFESMAKEKSAFMLWLGDNWYYREVDYYGTWGLQNRAHITRSLPVLQNFLKAMPHYAIWDDHDYGPNDADKSYILKNETRNIFKNYWPNPSFGENEQGIYTLINYGDVDIFMMDDRWFRSANDMEKMVNGQPNPAKKMWGDQEMEWLKNALISSKATFKIIATGNQTLNPKSIFECLQDYPIEFNELMNFLTEQKINGVLFFTGDRHHSEVIKYERPGAYPLYDVTHSPLTSGVAKVTGRDEEVNPARVAGTLVEAQNYTKVSVTGKPNERVLRIEYLGIKGEKLAEWSVSEKEIKNK